MTIDVTLLVSKLSKLAQTSKVEDIQSAMDYLDLCKAELTGVLNSKTPGPIEDREGWGGYDKNIYNSPEKCGLELLASAEEEPDYSFNITILLRDLDSGRFFMASDQGCSCPSPFEDFRSVSDLTEVTNQQNAIAFLNSNEPSYGGYQDEGVSVRKAIRENLPRW